MKAKPGICINFLPEEKNAWASHSGQTVLELALQSGIQINHTCGGFGTCGSCRVIVVEGLADLPSRNEIELELATDRNFSKEERLACQTLCSANLKIKIPEENI